LRNVLENLAATNHDINYDKVVQKTVSFIRKKVKEAGAEGVIIGLSGGVDSALTAYLAARALPKEKILILMMPDTRITPRLDIEDARTVAKKLGVDYALIDIAPIHRAFMKYIIKRNKVAEGNLRARIRMALLYYHANLLNRLVIGTGDKSEYLLGYFCYDEETRALTKEGLKRYDELRPGDIVFALNLENDKIEEREVKAVYTFNYSGRLLHYLSEHVDLCVTPNHRLIVNSGHPELQYHRKPRNRFETAESARRRRYVHLPVPNQWESRYTPPPTMTLSIAQRGVERTVVIDIDDWLYLVGLFIGDGCISKGWVTTCVKSSLSKQEYMLNRNSLGQFTIVEQEPRMKAYRTYETYFALPEGDRARGKLEAIQSKYGIFYSTTRNVVRFSCREFHDLFIGCGIGAKNKQIPQPLLDYPAKCLKHLFQGLLDSDGRGSHAYYTASQKLALQVVELALKLGLSPRLLVRQPRITRHKDKVIRTGVSYEVHFTKARTMTIQGSNIKVEHYSGIVWCPSIDGLENLVVERNGRFAISGNTKYGDGGVDILPIGDLLKTEVRMLARYLGIPSRICFKKSSPRLWLGHGAEKELGAEYEQIDEVFRLYFIEWFDVGRIENKTGMDRKTIQALFEKHRKTRHKRKPPSICRIRKSRR